MATITTDKPQIAEIPTGVEIDPVTLDIIEGALKSTRYEMDAVLFRSAMSPVIREQHDEFPMITDPRGRMVVGQFGAYINEMMESWDRGVYPGDVILTSDPFNARPRSRTRTTGSCSSRSSTTTSSSAGRRSSATRWTRAARSRLPAHGREDDLRGGSSSRRSRSSSGARCRRTSSG